MERKTAFSEKRKNALREIAAKIGLEFGDWNLLHQALTHTSYANEIKRTHVEHNERLEFLGDAVLELVVSTYLFKHFAQLPEGELTKARASIVCESTLAKRAAALQIGSYLLFGKGELTTGGPERASILADAFEAVIGAIYLDHGFSAAYDFVTKQLDGDFQSIEAGRYLQDYKTVLQEIVQKQSGRKISYCLLDESGPDHNKCFRIAVCIQGEACGTGEGRSKKEAEQSAARQALIKMHRIKE